MKKILAVLLLIGLLATLCACGETPEPTEDVTEAPTQNVTEAPTVDDGKVTYTAKVVDEGGNPIAGAMVQICKDTCFPGVTDENGVASFTREEEEGYKISFIALPEGYEYTTEETDFYFEGGEKDITITLKAIA